MVRCSVATRVRLAWAAARAAGGSTVVGDGAGERHRYLAEFDLRYSTKDKSDTGRASDILKGMEGRRLFGGLVASQPKCFVAAPRIGEPRKRWTTTR